MSVGFYLDEDVQVFLGEAPQARGIDAVHAYQADRGGDSDDAQLSFATAEGRCMVSYNRRDSARLAGEWMADGRHHAGVVEAVRRAPGDVLRSLVAVTAACTSEMLRDRLLFI